MIKYKLKNNLNNSNLKKIQIEDGTLAGTSVIGNSIAIPFYEQTKSDGYSDLIREIFLNEKDLNINEVIDNETIKF